MSFVPQTAPILGLPPDPFKHVHYTLGMVLGVDDFTQEFAYLSGHQQWLTRGVVGYGTVCGLRVTVESTGAAGPQVVVTPGTAINPRGQLIRMDKTKCARLNDWLLANRAAVLEHVGSPPGEDVRLYVVLCYRVCETDMVPIPGEPCRTEDDSMAASRLEDYHLLDLRFEPPSQRQYDGIRDLVAWLRQIPVDPVADTPALRNDFEQAIRDAIPQLMTPPQSPPSPPDYILGSPPAGLAIPADAVQDYLRLAFRLWVTEIRPLWLGRNESAAGHPPDEECVLLGEIAFPITAAGQVDGDESVVSVNEENRPILLSLQMLQEWLLSASAGEGVDGASAELRVDGGFIQWRQSDDDPTWTNLIALTDLKGIDGASAEMRRVGNEIQWRQSDDDPTWTALFNLDEIGGGGPGNPVVGVEMRVDGGFIQWRQSDDNPTWTNLVALADLTGPAGPRGQRGATQIIAAGRFNIDGSTVFEFKAMKASQLEVNPGLYFMTFDGYAAGSRYVIKGTVINELSGAPHVFEVLDGEKARDFVEERMGRGAWETGFLVRVMPTNGEFSAPGFMVEVSEF